MKKDKRGRNHGGGYPKFKPSQRTAMPQERHRRQRLSEQLREQVEKEHVD
jgi:hypothetical protein